MGRFLFVIHILFLLLATILILGSIGGFFGSGYMIVAALLVIGLWGIYAALTINAIRLAHAAANGTGSLSTALGWSNWLFLTVAILSVVTGLGFAILSFVGCGPVWIPSLYHWAGMTGTVLGLLLFFLLPVFVGEKANYHHWTWVFLPLGVVLLWGLVWLVPYLMLKGDINESEYSSADHIYLLPFPGGESSWVIQGNNSSFNHNDDNKSKPQKFSWDFRRPCGTPVLAARDGTVIDVDDSHDEMGEGKDNNKILVDHGDGTVASYLHIQKGSVPVSLRPQKTKDTTGKEITLFKSVNQGDEIAKVGSVGNSMTGHIHFMVKRGNNTIGVSFIDEDVEDDKGIPRTFHSYTSQKCLKPSSVGASPHGRPLCK